MIQETVERYDAGETERYDTGETVERYDTGETERYDTGETVEI